MPANVAPDLAGLVVPIADLRPDPRNARTHDDANVAAVKASLARHGQRKPIVATPDGVVLAGNCTLRAAVELGWDRIAVSRYDGEPATLRAYSVEDNRSAELAGWDPEALLADLAELEAAGILPADVGFSADDLARATAGLSGGAAGEAPSGFKDVDDDLETSFRCPKCSYEWSGKPK